MSGWESFCGSGNCLQTQHQLDGSVLLRCSTRPDEWIQVSSNEWSDFTNGIKADLQKKNTAQGMHMANPEYLLMQAQARINQLEESRP